MTPDQLKEVNLLVLNIKAVYTDQQVIELCARLLGIETSVMRAWLARQK